MLEFKEIDISDKNWIDELLKKSDFMACEYTFANNFAWRRLSDTKICRFKDFYVSCNYDENKMPYFTFPAGKGNCKELLSEMNDYSKSFDTNLKICSVNEEKLITLKELFPESFEIESFESNYDYIYKKDDLINLSGKKYHNKRNHLSKMNSYNWSFEPITEKNINECIEMSTIFYNSKETFDDKSSVVEQFAINTFFNYFNELELKGGLIRIDGNVEGFTIGEMINSNTFGVHIEKANPEINGAYAAINNEFLKYAAENAGFINREEDLGIEGLRKAKRSYYPCFLLKKYTITFKEGFKL